MVYLKACHGKTEMMVDHGKPLVNIKYRLVVEHGKTDTFFAARARDVYSFYDCLVV